MEKHHDQLTEEFMLVNGSRGIRVHRCREAQRLEQGAESRAPQPQAQSREWPGSGVTWTLKTPPPQWRNSSSDAAPPPPKAPPAGSSGQIAEPVIDRRHPNYHRFLFRLCDGEKTGPKCPKCLSIHHLQRALKTSRIHTGEQTTPQTRALDPPDSRL